MNGRIRPRLLLLTCVALALLVSRPLEAQFGGLGRRIAEGAKKAAGVESEEASKPATPSASEPVELPTNNPAVIPITDKVLEGFERAMRTEISLRDELRRELEAKDAADKKREACKQETAGSPEAQQIIMRLADVPENATPEQMTKMMAQMAEDSDALVLQKCGPVPAPIDTAQRLLDIRQKAAASAGPIS